MSFSPSARIRSGGVSRTRGEDHQKIRREGPADSIREEAELREIIMAAQILDASLFFLFVFLFSLRSFLPMKVLSCTGAMREPTPSGTTTTDEDATSLDGAVALEDDDPFLADV